MTGIAYETLLAEAEEQFPAFPVTFPDGAVVRLRSSLDLNDSEIQELSGIQEKLLALDESANLSELRDEYIRALVLVSDNPTTAQEKFHAAPLKAVVVLFQKYNESAPSAAKSEGSAPASS